ncbi:MAG: hypothetical protein WBD34_01535 [Burkholderiaceae bacterium]
MKIQSKLPITPRGHLVVIVALVFLLGGFQVPTRAEETQLALVEYYDPEEAESIEFSALLSWGKGHDQATALWRIHLEFGILDPQSDSIPFGATGVFAGLGSGNYTGIRLEHMISHRFGVELGVLKARGLSTRSAPGGANSTFESATLEGYSPYVLGLILHLTPERPLDLSVGLQIVNADHGDLRMSIRENGITSTVPVSSGVGWGLSAGVDVPVGDSGWLVHAGIRYQRMKFDYALAQPRRDTFHSYLLHVGVGYRF